MQRVYIGDLQVDATVTERPTIEVEVTDHPVEQGANVSDHARRKPDQLQIEGVVSGTPIARKEQLPPGYEQRPHEAYEFFDALATASDLVEIASPSRTYSDMRLVSFSAPRDAKTGDALRFTASFKQIRIVQNKTVLVKTKTPNGKPIQKKGGQATTEASEKQKSIAKKLADTSLGDQLLRGLGAR